MTDDLVTRLRALAAMYPQWGEVHDRALAAADEIERLRHENGAIQRVLGWPDEAPAILDACEGLDADTVEAALFIAQEVRSFQPLLLADWKPRAER